MKTLTKQSVIFILLILWQQQCHAIEYLAINIEQWAVEQFQAKDFDVAFRLTTQGLLVSAKAKQITLPEPLNLLTQVKMECTQLDWKSGSIHCLSGQLSFHQQKLGEQHVNFSLTLMPEREQYYLELSGLTLANGVLSVQLSAEQKNWQAKLTGKDISIGGLLPLLTNILEQQQIEAIQNWQTDAVINIKAQLEGNEKQLNQMDSHWDISNLNLANESASIVMENVGAVSQLELNRNNTIWQWQFNTQLRNGQAYADPVFLDFSEHVMQVSGKGEWNKNESLLDVTQFVLNQQALNVEVQLQIQQQQLKQISVSTDMAEMAQIYPIWLQPFLYGTSAEHLIFDGKAAMKLTGQSDQYQLTVSMDALSVEEQKQRFRFDNLNGTLAWSTAESVADSDLSWQQAKIYAIDLGETAIQMRSQMNGMTLRNAVDLPVLDGELKVEQFTLQQPHEKSVNWTFSGLLTPVSMDALSQALGWPIMHGKLSGVIPKVRYQQHGLEVDGALQVKLFDGTTVIRDLRMTSPLGALPQLYANIDVSNLDLELLTQTFDFGRITGRLDGYVHDLRLSNWQPVNFDAYLATPEENPGKRRISQKAVDNLSQIGGGATGLLSRSFLGFFEDFSYKKLGLSCKLRNETCEMNGVEQAQQGYYIVKGGGGLPPWINVVGYTRRVDWAELVARLQAVSESDGPVIE